MTDSHKFMSITVVAIVTVLLGNILLPIAPVQVRAMGWISNVAFTSVVNNGNTAVNSGISRVTVSHSTVQHKHDDGNHHHSSSVSTGFDGHVQIPGITPPNQTPFIPNNALQGSAIPKNLIVGPACSASCPPIVGTERDDIIFAVAVTDSIIYGLRGDDVITPGPGNPQVFADGGDDLIAATTGNTQMYGGNGDDILLGGTGNNILIGGNGNDQLFAGVGRDLLIGGNGADFFDCGQFGNGIILDYNPPEGDVKAANCKYVYTIGSTP
jgi:Ca2+-binding RTX toxin-like protein